MNTSDQRCAHTACFCTVRSGDAYCSEHCRKRVESPLSDQPEGCHCGHAPCADAQSSAASARTQRPK